MKILVIGNSHIASLKLGWAVLEENQVPFTTVHHVTFFAARGKLLKDLRVNKTSLVPQNNKLKRSLKFTSNGQTNITPSQYDVCLLHGMMRFPRYDRRISSAVKSTSLTRCVTNSLAGKLAAKIRRISNIPLYVSHQPISAWDNAEFMSAPKNYTPYNEIFTAMENAFPVDGATLVRQPQKTLDFEIATKQKYTQGSIRLQMSLDSMCNPHPENDLVHMNDIYGALQINEFIQALDLKM